jgi:hypothetical protein
MDARQKIYNDQLSNYCNLKDNEKLFVIDEKIIRKDSVYRQSFWGCKNKNRLAKAMLMHWDREIRNYKHTLCREITIDDVSDLQDAIESYQGIIGKIISGWGFNTTKIKKIDILEDLISDAESSVFKDIVFKKQGYIKEKYDVYDLWDKHIVTVIESDTHFTIKEIYIPYSGVVIQLPIE